VPRRGGRPLRVVLKMLGTQDGFSGRLVRFSGRGGVCGLVRGLGELGLLLALT